MPKTQIVKAVGISRSTLYNELKRGTVEQLSSEWVPYTRYFFDVGQRVYEEHRRNSRPPLKLAKAWEFVQYAEKQMLECKLSPDAICGRAKKDGEFREIVCTKTLYNYIDMCLLKVRNIDLPLRVKRKKKISHNCMNRRIYGMSIEERPAKINNREEFGHWEIDTIVSKQATSSVLLTLDECLTRRRHMFKIPAKTSEAVAEGISKLKQLYGDKFPFIFKSITSDNGSEFANLSNIFPETEIYYAHPYSSFERGTNEKQNSLVRRFFPKGKSFDNVSDDAIARVEDWINLLSRKIFAYRSSLDLFRSVLFDIAI